MLASKWECGKGNHLHAESLVVLVYHGLSACVDPRAICTLLLLPVSWEASISGNEALDGC